ncbi:MAG: hypothetical protein IJP44_12775 [Bacteroidales bacterium]|nr:hypothetical protein [Bacteroidales bacterium]
MKKLLIRIGIVAVLLVAMNWVYSKWFYENDLQAHSDMVNLPRQVVADSCRIVYLGESSNRTYGWAESDQRKISDMVWTYFPNLRCGDMTKDASHAEIYYNMLKIIPKESSVETVVVTMNLRSFDAGWIYSRLETALQKQLVLLRDYPPLVNRFLLAFKAYPIRGEAEWDQIVSKHWKKDPIEFPYDFEWTTVHQWDSAMAWHGWIDPQGQRDDAMTDLACHYIKAYAFQIRDDNPRVKDFDKIVELCQERGWNLVFNLLAENVDKANELVGKDLVFLMKMNRDYLVKRYGDLEGVTVVDNLNLVRDVNFIDQNWTTEHYYAEGRHLVANRIALALRELYPNDFVDDYSVFADEGHFHFGKPISIDAQQPYSYTLDLPMANLREDWEKVNVSFMVCQSGLANEAVLAVQWYDSEENGDARYYPIQDEITTVGQWDFATFALPVDSTLRLAKHFKIFVYNPSETPIQVKDLDISFRPAYMKPGVKGESER